MTSSRRKVTIIGAGFSGLASAYYLVRAGFDVEVFEKSARVGGLISTLRAQHGPVETAANGFLNSALVEELFSSLNVPLQGASRLARKRYIFREGRARRWPLGLGATLRVIWFGLRFILARSLVKPREGESIEVWGNRALGAEACRYFLSTALQGIYAGDATRMSARLILGRIFGARASESASDGRPQIGHRKPRVRGTVAPLNGMGQLIAALEADLRARGVTIHLNATVRPSSDHPVIVATSPSAAAEFVDEDRARLLRQIEMRPVATTTAFFEHTDEKSKGFGVLFPPAEAKFLGVLKNNFIFKNRLFENSVHLFSETWIRGGVSDDSIILSELRDERRRVFGLDEKPLEAIVTKWPGAIPHYTLELERAIPALERAKDNVFLMGNYLGDLGLAKILERASRWPERLKREATWSEGSKT
jgi:oxygen-dependent protoporphyrinogen oxidase